MHVLNKTFLLCILIIFEFNFQSAAQSCSIFAGNDTVLCTAPVTLNLNAQLSGTLDECTTVAWSPATGLSNPAILNPVASVTSSITYTVSANIPFGPNLIANGDFEAGNSSFGSPYTHNCPFGGILNENQYCVTDDPHNVHTGATSCGDHTSGSGLMMVVNGSTTSNSTFWSQNVSVNPNTYYLFTFYTTNWSSITYNLPTFDIKVNGVSQGLTLTIDPLQCSWKKNCLLWYSDASTSASFKIIDQVDFYIGNDFSIDDIMLQEVCLVTDSIEIIVEETVSQQVDTSVCEGSLLTLSASSGSAYSWSPASGLNCTTCQAVSFTADSSITYVASGISSLCPYADTFVVNVDTMPYLSLPNDTFLCEGDQFQIVAQSSSGVSWSPSSSLSCLLCNDPVATPSTATTYFAAVTNGTCSSYDSILIDVKSFPLNTLVPDADICLGNSVVLTVDSGYLYTLTPGDGLNCDTCNFPVATPDSTITYTVSVSDSGCSITDSITIFVSYTDKVTATPNDSICKGETIQLSATGVTNYVWTPSSSLDHSDISNPVAAPLETTAYIVIGQDACGISADTVIIVVGAKPVVEAVYDSIIYCNSGTTINLNGQGDYLYHWLNPDVEDPAAPAILVNPAVNTIYLVNVSNKGCDTLLQYPVVLSSLQGIVIPNAFSPNGDGVNDVFRILDYCPLDLNYFRIFNRWGQVVFETTNIDEGWNGNFHDTDCPLGVYIYVISGTKPSGNDTLMKGDVTLIR